MGRGPTLGAHDLPSGIAVAEPLRHLRQTALARRRPQLRGTRVAVRYPKGGHMSEVDPCECGHTKDEHDTDDPIVQPCLECGCESFEERS